MSTLYAVISTGDEGGAMPAPGVVWLDSSHQSEAECLIAAKPARRKAFRLAPDGALEIHDGESWSFYGDPVDEPGPRAIAEACGFV